MSRAILCRRDDFSDRLAPILLVACSDKYPVPTRGLFASGKFDQCKRDIRYKVKAASRR
jgi:hypothetical protein